MVRGGHAASGPPPDPNALRRDRPSDASGWTTLPAAGRPGRPPEFPLEDVQPREWDLWRDLWSRPQAVMWEQMGQEYEVALLARSLQEAEKPGARTEVLKVTRQLMESLGLTVQGMLRNRWKVDRAIEAPVSEAPGAAAVPRRSSRDRLKVVPHGDGAS